MAERLSDKNPCINCKVDRQIGNPNRWECECSRCDKPNDWKNGCINKLAEYETAEDEGRLVVLPVGIEDEVYIIEKCENIPEELDGTLYDSDWGPGTATGYYCIYQDECPFDGEDFTDCDCYKQKYAIFKDFIGVIQVTYDGINIFSERICIPIVIGKNAFLTRGEAEEALKEMEGK